MGCLKNNARCVFYYYYFFIQRRLFTTSSTPSALCLREAGVACEHISTISPKDLNTGEINKGYISRCIHRADIR